MKAEVIIAIWVISFALSALFVESLNCVFWLSFAVFSITSVYLEKNSDRIERELTNSFN